MYYEMKRPLAILGLAVLVCVSGCAGLFGSTPDAPPSITAENVTVAQGATTELEVTVERATSVQINSRNANRVAVATGDAEISPRPDSVAESLPPTWMWDRSRNVRISLPINASGQEAGRYNYTVTARNHVGESNVTRAIRVTAP
jgi:hypothetical protein